jgi:hypothetical protein
VCSFARRHDYFAVASDEDASKKEMSPTRSQAKPSNSVASIEPKSLVEPALKNMTVETETVTTAPPSHLTTAEPNGTLRVKASNETIRPKKERKKASKKAQSAASAARMSPTVIVFESLVSTSPTRKGRAKSYPILPQTPSSASRESRKTSLSMASPGTIGFNALSALRNRFSNTNLVREASTRSEVFENRVKMEMEDATSDDSDETFVYESNPHDPPIRRSKHHSRTPSGASLASAQDRGPSRGSQTNLERMRPLQKPRSMKFSSAASNYGNQDNDSESIDGPVRMRERNGSHFSGRQGRTLTGQSVLLDEENPIFPGMSKTRSLTAVGGRSSAARLLGQQSRNSSTRRPDGFSTLEMDADAADDEHTPLLSTATTGTVRQSGRTRAARNRYRFPDYPPPRRNLLARLAGCLLILVTVSVLIAGVICFLFALSKPLEFVSILDIKGVIASEQELMFDIVVEATNPNLVSITVSELDIYCFAQSKYSGSQKWWRDHGREPSPNDTSTVNPSQLKRTKERLLRRRPFNTLSKHDKDVVIAYPPSGPDPTDPNDPNIGKKPLLLGQILKFDNPLIFDGSFWNRMPAYASGSVRLSKPANHTEAGGTDRWERVLQHDFELQIRGVITYTIPLGGRTMNASIHAKTPVKGTGEDDDEDDEDDKKDSDGQIS